MSGGVLAGRRRSAEVAPLSYLDTVLFDNPVGFWLLDEPSGTTFADQVEGGTAATYGGNAITYHATGPSTQIPYGVSTWGTPPITMPTYSFGTTHPQSYEIWANCSFEITSSTGMVRILEPAFFAGNAFGALADEVMGVDSWGSGRQGWTGFTIPAGWHHLMASYTGTITEWTFYLDGEATGTPVTYGEGVAGAPGNVNAGWNVELVLAACSVYDTCLSADAVSDHYAAGIV